MTDQQTMQTTNASAMTVLPTAEAVSGGMDTRVPGAIAEDLLLGCAIGVGEAISQAIGRALSGEQE